MNSDLAGIYNATDFQGFSDLRRMAREDAPEAADTAARQFEALFIQMMLKSMRDAMPVDSGMEGDQTRFYRDMFDQQIALEMSRGEGIGMRESLLRELAPGTAGAGAIASADLTMPARRITTPGRSTSDRPAIAPAAASPPPSIASSAAQQGGPPQSPEAFLRELWPHAEAAGAALGLAPEILLAQSALETGWGRHVIQDGAGGSSHNLFGIKADAAWDGPRVHVQTLEYVNGIPERQRAAFRAYDNPAASFADYVDFLQRNPRYREALARVPDAEGYLRGLQEAGYATDPDYADKILDILNRGTLRQMVELKSDAARPIS
ncbi:flagellar assembly peptidoglycan hydrolase FlgJ [Thioalkalivibrio sp.]|uniref:flagellar assembly peptidoglycan hydrolase FlgJ n=1 Tax=Thioalkalivibrio sp. TaxID=2093813 RepID=UPI0039754EFE